MGKHYLQSNSKLRNSSIYSYAFNLPAVKTCPGAGACAKAGWCFAKGEEKRYPQAADHRAASLALAKSGQMVDVLSVELTKLVAKHGVSGFAIRIHASGDFYSGDYVNQWVDIARRFPEVQFYAYTKSVHLFHSRTLPTNLTIIYSLGGRFDSLVNVEKDRHARIFGSEAELYRTGYVLASEDDTVAWKNPSTKIGLVAFGAVRKWADSQPQEIEVQHADSN